MEFNREQLKILGITPARGGSKSIPRKNIKDFLGKPLIAWTIETALASNVCDKFIVSTDDNEIADVSKSYGAEIPFIRPSELAQDATPTLPVLQHAVKWLKDNKNYYPDLILLMECVCPSKRPRHLIEAVELFKKSDAESLITVVEAPAQYNPHWLFKMNEKGFAELFTGEEIRNIIPRRQLLPKVYSKNGAFYLFKTDCLFRDPPSLFGDKTMLYVMDSIFSVDIDEPSDWPMAEQRMRQILELEEKKS